MLRTIEPQKKEHSDFDPNKRAFELEIRDCQTDEVLYTLKVNYPEGVDPRRGDFHHMSLENWVEELIFDPDKPEYVGAWRELN